MKNNIKDNAREYNILRSDGFEFQFEEIKSEQFIGLETRVYNKCEDMTQADYDFYRSLSTILCLG